MGGRRTAASAPEQPQTKHTSSDLERGEPEPDWDDDGDWLPDVPDPCNALLETRYEQPDGYCNLDVNHDDEWHEDGSTGYRWRDGDRGALPSNNPRATS